MIIYRSLFRTVVHRTVISHPSQLFAKMASSATNGDLNNTAAERARRDLAIDPAYAKRSFAIPSSQDDAEIRKSYRPFLLNEAVAEHDWVAQLELSTVLKMVDSQVIRNGGERLRVLVLHGSMRKRYLSLHLSPDVTHVRFMFHSDDNQILLPSPSLRSKPHPLPHGL
jgi:arsenic resistance protein ArsH